MGDDNVTQSLRGTDQTLPRCLIHFRCCQLHDLIDILAVTWRQSIINCQQMAIGDRGIDLINEIGCCGIGLWCLVGRCCRWLG